MARMFALGFILLASGLWLASSAYKNRPPMKTLQDIFKDPGNLRATLDSNKDTFVHKADYGKPLFDEVIHGEPNAGTAESLDAPSPAAAKAVAYAMAQVGKPYKWGAEGPNAFDCSGLIYAAYDRAIPRTTAGQIVGGKLVSKTALLPGDLVFPYPGHVFMYIGGGKTVEAPHTGTVVKIGTVYQFFTARRYG